MLIKLMQPLKSKAYTPFQTSSATLRRLDILLSVAASALRNSLIFLIAIVQNCSLHRLSIEQKKVLILRNKLWYMATNVLF